jgi:hypothetical protein
MPRRFALAPALELDELAAYHQDVVASLRLYFSPSSPTYTTRFAGESEKAVRNRLDLRLAESDIRSTFTVLTSLEASFRIDFEFRCRMRLKDKLSVYFRDVYKQRRDRTRLNEDILEGWKKHTNVSARDISALRAAFKFRHWLAHGRYWTPRHPKYDFDYVHSVADSIISGFRFVG